MMRPIARYGFLGSVRKLLSQAAFFIDAKESGMGQTATNLGTAGSVLDAQYGSTTGSDTNDPLLLEHDGTNYLYLPGVAGNYASTPDAAALDITGDIDARVLVLPDDLVSSANYDLISKWNVAGSVSWGFTRLATGALRLYWSTNGTASISASSTAVFSFAASTPTWLRVTLDVSNPANPSNGYDVAFYSSADGSTWAQIGATVVGAASTSIFSGTSALHVGGNGLIAAGAMKVYRAQVLNGIGGTVVFDADFTTGITSGGQTTFTESSSNAATVTINRSTSGRKSVAVVRDVWLFGTDDYLQVADNDLLDFGASDSFTVVTVLRQWATPANNGFYLDKRLGAAPNTGYRLQTNGTALQYGSGLDDGPTGVFPAVVTMTAGSAIPYGIIVNRETQTAANFAGTTIGATSSTAALGSLANSNPLIVGGQSIYQDFELLGVAIFRRALSASEIASIANYYGAA